MMKDLFKILLFAFAIYFFQDEIHVLKENAYVFISKLHQEHKNDKITKEHIVAWFNSLELGRVDQNIDIHIVDDSESITEYYCSH